MNTSLTYAITQLAKGEILRVDNALGQSIALVRGMVWVTQEGDPRDIFLSDGENFVFNCPGTALVEAIADTRLLAFVGEAAEVIETDPALPITLDAYGGHRALAERIQLHRDLAAHAQLTRVPAHRSPSGNNIRSQAMKTIFDSLREWLRRSNERYALGQLSDRQLRDIGLNPALVLSETTKPFWRA